MPEFVNDDKERICAASPRIVVRDALRIRHDLCAARIPAESAESEVNAEVLCLRADVPLDPACVDGEGVDALYPLEFDGFVRGRDALEIVLARDRAARILVAIAWRMCFALLRLISLPIFGQL